MSSNVWRSLVLLHGGLDRLTTSDDRRGQRRPHNQAFRLLAVAAVATLLVGSSACSGCTDPPPAENNGGSNNGGSNNGGSCEVGERTCTDNRTLSTCARSADGSARLITTTCLDSEECRDGDCIDLPKDCDDTCTPPETRCTAAGEVETCADHNSDGCMEFGSPRGCDSGQVCDPADGLCKASMCTDGCAEGQTSCEQDLITTCARNSGGCLDWGPAKECPEGQTCQGGTCTATAGCTDECQSGETACTGDGQLRTCVTDADADSCTEFTAPTACPGGQTCRGGECVAENSCQDQCIAGETVCLANDLARCETNAEGCLEFSTPTPCPNNETCQSTNGAAACAPVMMTGKVVINEIFYDAVDLDVRNGETPTFIELFGPAGFPVGGYKIELINGSNGLSYNTFTLPMDAQLDGGGFAVIATDFPDGLLTVLPFFTNVYYVMTAYASGQDALQNGPDGVKLLDASDMELDSVAYGDFDPASHTFTGEGTCANAADCQAAPKALGGRSVGRKGGADTDNNKADFLTYYPTPGFPNSDLLINEIYFSQPGADDGSETFVELVAPILGWEDMPLDGYVLHAINGFNGMDYIMTGVLPGIDFMGWNLNDGNGEDGYVIVCNIDFANPTLLDMCTVPYEGVDFQNGPDNFVLTYNGRVIDAVGYGTFAASDTFSGEGSAAPFSSMDAGKSLARWPFSDFSRELDTDNNAADFFIVDPTPSADNPLPNP